MIAQPSTDPSAIDRTEGLILASSAADRDHMVHLLEDAGIPVTFVAGITTPQAAQRARTLLIDLAGAPDLDETWKVIAQEGSRAEAPPLLVLAADHRRRDCGRALNMGVTDAVSRPLCDSELLARVAAALRLARGEKVHTDRYSDASLEVDFSAFSARFGRRTATLSALEARLLELFVRNPGRLLTQEEILTSVWGPSGGVSVDQVKLYVSYLRRKLGMSAHEGPIHSVRGRGYRYDPRV